MVRPLLIALLGLAATAPPALADEREPPVHFEMGLNTRHFSASAQESVALRTVEGATDDGSPGGTGVTVSFRFTKWLRWNTIAGVEAESGTLTARNSNVAGAYALFGARHEVGPIALFVELAGGKRWVRYSLMEPNHDTWMLEPRVRAETWLSERFTLGGALGSTLSADVRVWMAGIYIGVHSLEFGKR